MSRQDNKEFWEEFVQLYQENPCLWNTECEDYSNESKRNIALGMLVEKMWEIDTNADKDTVIKRIKLLKAQLAEEEDLFRNSNGDIYVSAWPLYHSLSFLTPFVGEKRITSGQVVQNDFRPEFPAPVATVEISSSTESRVKRQYPFRSTETEDRDEARCRRLGPPDPKPVDQQLLRATHDEVLQKRVRSTETEDRDEARFRRLGPRDPKPVDQQILRATRDEVLQGRIRSTETDDQDGARFCRLGPYDRIPADQNVRATRDEVFKGRNKMTPSSGIPVNPSPGPNQTDDCAIFADYLTTRMRSFDPLQKIIAQKLMSDIIFLADTKQLLLKSVITNTKQDDT